MSESDNRIEMQSPGGLYGKVSPDNFPNVSDYRNPFIAEAMKIMGYVNRFSRGVYRVQKELVENKNGEASFDFSLATAFKVAEKVSEKYSEAGFEAEDTQEKPKNIHEEILAEMKSNPQVTRKELALILNCTQDSTRYHLRQLTSKGIIKYEGSTKAGKWVIL